MLDIFLCHGPGDDAKADVLSNRLASATGARVSREACHAQDNPIPETWDQGLSSSLIVLLLSPGAVPKTLKLPDWNPLIEHALGSEAPPVVCVLTAPCAYPKLLERRRFFTWEATGVNALREVERIAQSLLPPPETPTLELAPLPWFTGRQAEMDILWKALVDQPGTAIIRGDERTGKTALAQEFARQARRHFRELYWIRCGGASPAYLAGELGVQTGVTAGADEETALVAIRDELARRRALLVLDNVGDTDVLFLPGGRLSAIVTSREPLLVPGAEEIVLEDSYPQTAGQVQDEDAAAIARTMTVCDPHGFPAMLAGQMAGLDPERAKAACDTLVAAGCADPLDRGGEILRFPSGTPVRPLQRWHAETLAEIFAKWRQESAACDACAAEWERAFEWSLRHDWDVAKTLGQRGFAFFRWRGRSAEARLIMARLHAAAREQQDREMLEECDWELSWFSGARVEGPRGGGGEQLAFDFG